MDTDAIDAILAATLDDVRLSRSERKALSQVLAEHAPAADDLALWRHRAFALARDAVSDPAAREVLGWVEDVVKALQPAAAPDRPVRAEVLLSPGDGPQERLRLLLDSARRSVDVCVFTITDDRLADAVLRAHARGVKVRVVTDDEKALDRGSDTERLHRAGVPLRTDRSEHHMHHKFAVFDRHTVATGSYNWTRSAAAGNRENLAVTDSAPLVEAYLAAFQQIWDQLA